MEPYLRGVTAGSTTDGRYDGKMSRSSATQKAQRPKADPLPQAGGMGARTPVSMTVTYRGGNELWYEIVYGQGKVYVLGTDSIHSIAQKLIQGGHRVQPLKRQRRGTTRRTNSAE